VGGYEMTELKKCPFCGSEPGYIKDVDGEWIWCSNVECMGGNGSGERWNTRPLEDALQVQLNELKNENDDLMGDYIAAAKRECDLEYIDIPKLKDERDALQSSIEILYKEMVEDDETIISLQAKLAIAVAGINKAIGYGNRMDIYKVLNDTLFKLEEK
jgi:hypothetical protein